MKFKKWQWGFRFWLIWSNKDWIYFLPLTTETPAKESIWHSDSEDMASVKNNDPWEIRSKLDKPYDLPSLLPEERFQAVAYGGEIQAESGGFFELRKPSWEFPEAKADGIYWTEHHKGESSTESALEAYRWSSFSIQLSAV